MSLRIRKQYPEFDINEFTEERTITVDNAVSEVRDFDWDTENAKSAKIIEQHADPLIRLINDRKEILDIYRGDKEKYNIEYRTSSLIPRTSAALVQGYNSAFELVKVFSSGDKRLLVRKLKTMEYYYKTLLIVDILRLITEKPIARTNRNIQSEEYTYDFKLITLLNKLTFSLCFLFMAPIIWGFLLKDKPFNLMAFLGMQFLMTLFALPGFIIAFNYWRKNGKWKVLFKKRDNIFIILTPEKREIFNKQDFTKRIRTENSSNAPWSSFEYTTIVMNDGRQIHLSNILIPNSDIDKFFGRIEETTEKKGFQIIQDKKITTANNSLLQAGGIVGH
jgi:hypothetical protein